MKPTCALLIGALACLPAEGRQSTPDPDGDAFFERRIRPLLLERCLECHRGPRPKGGLSLETREAIRRGGDSGPALVPGDPDASLLIHAVRGANKDLRMPPKGKERLTPEQIADLAAWIRRGAPDPRDGAPPPPSPAPKRPPARPFWSFQPLASPAVPPVKDGAWPRNDVDRFILAKLEEQDLRPGADADKLALLRRATFDLLGLPPTPEEVGAFLADGRPDAFDRVVDRLLASPRYGERWGRHWLDLVRYADTAGDNSDYPVPQAYRYRDYVIRSFNQDKPYDRFLREQIAGDLLPFRTEEDRKEHLIATGFIAIARRFGTLVLDYNPHQIIEDTIDTLGRSVLGLTLGCARCHDHKFDPLTQADYYGLYGIFESTRYPFPGLEEVNIPRDFVPLLPQAQVDAILGPHRARLEPLEAKVRRLTGERATLVETPSADGLSAADIAQRLRTVEKSIAEAKKERDDVARQEPSIDSAYAVIDAERTGNARIHVKGDPRTPGTEAPRRPPAILGGSFPADVRGSGRLELATWLTDPKNPLPARVLVNRLWQHHFGAGLVATPSDLGTRGSPPSHPELLDFLAREFLDGGWSVKSLHRLLLRSRTYRLSSRDISRNLDVDPQNRLLWKYARRRLEAEAIRDAVLSVSGALDLTPAGPHPFPPMNSWRFSQHQPFTAVYPTQRRSVYLMTQRFKKHPFLAIFDGADPNATTPQRTSALTPVQALFMMNDPFVREQARLFGARLLAEAGTDRDRIGRAYLLALGRPPDEEERLAGEAFLRESSWPAYAHALFSLNEFIFVE